MNGRRSRASRRRLALMLTAKPAVLAMGAVAQQQVASAANISVGCNAILATREGDLKSAITAANAASGSTTISLAPNCVYTLTTPQSGNNGLAAINKTVVVDGNNATITRDNSAADFRILRVTNNGNLTLNHVTISNGVATNDTGGGGVWNFGGTLNVNSSTITGNTASATGTGSISAKGGGILSGGTTTVTDSDVSGNHVVVTAGQGTASVVASGGGMSAKGGTLTVSHTTLSSNSATANAPTLAQVLATGGGIAAKGGTIQGNGNVTLNVIGSTINGNTATANGNGTAGPTHLAEGGGIDGSNVGINANPRTVTVKVVNSTVTGNSAVDNTNAAVGGGLNSNNLGGPASLAVVNSTVANNVANHGAIATNTTGPSSPVTTTNTIVASNTGGNCRNTIIDGGHNISFPATDSSCANTFAQGDPLLGVLGNNGGLTKTMALGLGSAAIDTADRTVCQAAQPGGAGGVDQRGTTRTEVAGDPSCDIGAFEVQPVAAAAAAPGLPRSGTTTPTLEALGLPPWAPAVPAAVAAATLVGVARLRRDPD